MNLIPMDAYLYPWDPYINIDPHEILLVLLAVILLIVAVTRIVRRIRDGHASETHSMTNHPADKACVQNINTDEKPKEP